MSRAASTTGGAALNERVASCQPMVRSIAWQLSQRLPRSVEVDELIGEGQLGLLRAARDYDPGKGAQFSTYAYWRIRGAMLDWVRQQDWSAGHAGVGDAAESHRAESHRAERGGAESDGAERDGAERATQTVRTTHASLELADDDEAADPARSVSENELREVVRGLVGNLSGRSRQILQATLLDGQTLEQAGRAVGVHKGTAQRAQVRAFDELAAALQAKGLSELNGPDLRRAVLKPAPERRRAESAEADAE